MTNAAFFSLSTLSTSRFTFFGSVSLYPLLSSTFSPMYVFLTLLVLCHTVHYCVLHSLHSLSTSNRTFFGSLSLCPLFSSIFCQLSVSTSHCTVSWVCVTISNSVIYILHNICLPHAVPSPYSVSIYTLFPSTVCPLCLYLNLYISWFCVTMSTDIF